jgi:hypothetical protein
MNGLFVFRTLWLAPDLTVENALWFIQLFAWSAGFMKK